jgi:hypothetical protein
MIKISKPVIIAASTTAAVATAAGAYLKFAPKPKAAREAKRAAKQAAKQAATGN